MFMTVHGQLSNQRFYSGKYRNIDTNVLANF